MKRILFLAAFAGLCWICGCDRRGTDTPDDPSGQEAGTHTLLIYMMGNNGLEDFMDQNITRILSAYPSVPETGRVALFYDRGNYTRLTEIVVEDNMTKQKLMEEWTSSETSSVDPSFMKSVLDKVRSEMPADTYGLILSSHGGGWVPASLFDEYSLSASGTSVPAGIGTRFFGQDDEDCMEITDLAKVLGEGNWEYVIFDACFMSSVEALYDLRKAAQYIIASPAEILGSGYPYRSIIPMLFSGEDAALENVCRAFMNTYRKSSGTLSLISCAALDKLASAVKAIYASASEISDFSAIQGYEGFPVHLYYDLEQWAEAVSTDAASLAAFKSALAEAVVYTDHSETFYTDYGTAGYYDLPRSCGVTCHVKRAEKPSTHEAWLATSWAAAIGAVR